MIQRIFNHTGPFAFAMAAILCVFWTPEAAAQPRSVRIMPLGDSLTSSVNGQASYRYWLSRVLSNRSYRFDFVGSLWGVGNGVSGTYPDFDQDHEGHPGATTDTILYSINNWMAQAQPDIVLLSIGSNDFLEGKTAMYALANTRRIIIALRTANPNVSIIWATIPPSAGIMGQIRTYNSGVLRYGPAWSTAKSPIRVVDLYSGFSPARDTIDGEHPNESGEKKLALRFFNQIAAVYPRYRR